jgi:hypothetical protein
MKRSAKILIGALAIWATPGGGTALAQANDPTHRYLETPRGEKPRLVVTTDPELDDLNSLIRYLLYSADFRTEGLVYASSQFHWKGDGKGTKLSVPGREYTRFGLDICPCTSWRWGEEERHIDDAVDAYAKAYPNLRIHNPEYPPPELLRAKIRWGNVEFDGDFSKDTAGSELIKSLILDDERSPVYLLAWGGQSTIARALKSIEEQFEDTPEWQAIRDKVIAKAAIYASGDQDDTYARYIAVDWPDLRYVELRDGPNLAYGAQLTASKEDSAYLSAEWTRENISSQGPLGELYRVWGDGKQMVEGDVFDFFGFAGKTAEELRSEGYAVWTPPQPQGSFVSEGDTPTFLNFIDNGLDGYHSDTFGGWGGLPSPTSFNYGQAMAGVEQSATAPRQIERAPTHPFFSAIQREFAARMTWATTPDYKDANHAPRVRLLVSETIEARPGETVRLRAVASDPDGDDTFFHWHRWDAAGTYAGPASLENSDGGETSIRIPATAAPGETIHVIAQVTDNGSPSLTGYGRVAISIAD